MNISLNGFDNKVITVNGAEVQVGNLVKFIANNKVVKCGANDNFIGICVSVRNDVASVLVSGYVELPYSGTPTLGYTKLKTNSTNGVTVGTDADNQYRLITKIDSDNKKIGVIL